MCQIIQGIALIWAVKSYYGKYQIASIREVSLEEWAVFSDADKNRWAEHMLEHQWGKMILQKKKLLTEEQCVKSNWTKVLGFFNRVYIPPSSLGA